MGRIFPKISTNRGLPASTLQWQSIICLANDFHSKPRMLCNRNGAISHLQTETIFFQDFRYSLYNWWKYIFCPIWNLLCENRNLKRNFSKKVIYKPLMGCSLFSNSHFQMGVTVMGFAEHFGLTYILEKKEI